MNNTLIPYIDTDPYSRGALVRWSFAIYLVDLKTGKYSECDAFGDFQDEAEAIEFCEFQPIYSDEYDGYRLEVWEVFNLEGSLVRETRIHVTQRDPITSIMLPHLKALASVYL